MAPVSAAEDMAPLPRVFGALGGRVFDVLVLGGGINGVGVARDAARRGLSVALVEKEDFGYGTTGRSTRLAHGGLRYLAMYDFGLVRESLVERERLFRNAPHLVRPLRFLIPYYKGQKTPPWMLKMGLVLYDALAGDSVGPKHATYSRDALLELEPGLSREGLRGGASYTDGQIELVERLCIENVMDAVAQGAVVVNHARVEAIDPQWDASRVVVRDLLTDETLEVRAKWIVNTSGPWLDRVPGMGAVPNRMTKGVHLVTPQHTRHAILLFSPDDDRVFFSIPWLGQQLVGTTDTDFTGEPDEVQGDAADVSYLQRGIRRVLPDAEVDTVHYAYAGIRNLVMEEGKSESEVSRKHQVLEPEDTGFPRMLTLVGGKITPYRATSEELVDIAARDLGAPRSDTARAPLPGAPDDFDALVKALRERADALHVVPGAADTLARTYGTRGHGVLDRVAREPHAREVVCPHAPMIAAEIPFVIETEMARTAADVLLRRSSSGWEPCQGLDALPAVLDALDHMLGRTAAQRKADEQHYVNELAKRQRWRARS